MLTVVAEATADENLEEAAELLVEVARVDVAVRQLGDDGLHRVVKLAPALSILQSPSSSYYTIPSRTFKVSTVDRSRWILLPALWRIHRLLYYCILRSTQRLLLDLILSDCINDMHLPLCYLRR